MKHYMISPTCAPHAYEYVGVWSGGRSFIAEIEDAIQGYLFKYPSTVAVNVIEYEIGNHSWAPDMAGLPKMPISHCIQCGKNRLEVKDQPCMYEVKRFIVDVDEIKRIKQTMGFPTVESEKE